eukprot:m.6563 g.6563  ORF g.6563 m.6563 type:complete len:486 (+) comp3853_c0_seq2:34-1491(+)
MAHGGGVAVVVALDDDCGPEPRVFHPGDAVNGSVWLGLPKTGRFRVKWVELSLSAREFTSVVTPTNTGSVLGAKQAENRDSKTLFQLPTLVLCGSTDPEIAAEVLPNDTAYRMPFSLQVPDTAPSTYAVSAGTASTIGNARVKTMLVATVYTDSPKNNSASYAIELPIASHVHLDDALEHDHKRSLDHQNHFSSCCGSSFDTDLHISRATFCYGEVCKFGVSHGVATNPTSSSAVRSTKVKARLKAVTEFKAAGFKTRSEYYGDWCAGKLSMDGGNCRWDFAVKVKLGDTGGDVLPRHSFLGVNILVKWYIELNFQKSRFTQWNKFHHLFLCNVMTLDRLRLSHPHPAGPKAVQTVGLPSRLEPGTQAQDYPSYQHRSERVTASSPQTFKRSVLEMPDQGEQLLHLVVGQHRDVGPPSSWLDDSAWVARNLAITYLGAPLGDARARKDFHGVHRVFSGSVKFTHKQSWLHTQRISGASDVKLSQV